MILLQSAYIVELLWSRSKQSQTQITALPSYAQVNPIIVALNYECSLAKFEKVVQDNPQWINCQFKGFPGADQRSSALSACASLTYTNYIRILLKYGADPIEAERWLKINGDEKAANLVKTLAGERALPQPHGIQPKSVDETNNPADDLPRHNQKI